MKMTREQRLKVALFKYKAINYGYIYIESYSDDDILRLIS